MIGSLVASRSHLPDSLTPSMMVDYESRSGSDEADLG